MTERMENTIRHIKSGVDVDPWAAEEVERVFKAVDDIKAEIEGCRRKVFRNDDGTFSPYMDGTIERVLQIIEKHIGGLNMDEKRMIEEIQELVSECEAYQESNDSSYHKEQEKVIVYDKIVEILKGVR